jgi:hypothetical protein
MPHSQCAQRDCNSPVTPQQQRIAIFGSAERLNQNALSFVVTFLRWAAKKKVTG